MELNQIPQYVQQQLTDFFAHLAYDSLPTYSNSEFSDHEETTERLTADTKAQSEIKDSIHPH